MSREYRRNLAWRLGPCRAICMRVGRYGRRGVPMQSRLRWAGLRWGRLSSMQRQGGSHAKVARAGGAGVAYRGHRPRWSGSRWSYAAAGRRPAYNRSAGFPARASYAYDAIGIDRLGVLDYGEPDGAGSPSVPGPPGREYSVTDARHGRRSTARGEFEGRTGAECATTARSRAWGEFPELGCGDGLGDR
jgi:hypothetical protein